MPLNKWGEFPHRSQCRHRSQCLCHTAVILAAEVRRILERFFSYFRPLQTRCPEVAPAVVFPTGRPKRSHHKYTPLSTIRQLTLCICRWTVLFTRYCWYLRAFSMLARRNFWLFQWCHLANGLRVFRPQFTFWGTVPESNSRITKCFM